MSATDDTGFEQMLLSLGFCAGLITEPALGKKLSDSVSTGELRPEYLVILRDALTKALGESAPERSPADWRRLTGLWRFSVSVCPPTCEDFGAWLDVLDAAIDERTSRTKGGL